MLQDGLFFFAGSIFNLPEFPRNRTLPLRIPLYLLIPLFIIGGGLYAIPYQISLSSMNLMSAVCGVFPVYFVFYEYRVV